MVDQKQWAVGTQFSTDCQISGTFSTVQWSLEASALPSNVQTDNTGVLTIAEVQPDNEGLYKCSANGGKDVGATQINLTVLGKILDNYASIRYTVYGCTCICDVCYGLLYVAFASMNLYVSLQCVQGVNLVFLRKMKVHWCTFQPSNIVYLFTISK